MKRPIGKISMLVVSAALAACSGDKTDNNTTGSVGLALSIPDGRNVETINLRLVCPDSFVDQNHTLNVVNRNVVATFGGLAPGVCTATMTSATTDGYDCAGSGQFTIVAGEKVGATIDVVCQGTNNSNSGGVSLVGQFRQNECANDRIKKVFAIPSDLLLGESTLVEVELNGGAVVGTPSFSWATRNSPTHTAQGTLAAGTCSPSSASCQAFTCTGLGAAQSTDPRTGLPTAGVFVTVTVEDAECYDTEEVWVDCLQSSVCGDGNREGVEACDDGNTASNDGCSATCLVEACGDGVLQTNEQCDGLLGVGPNQGCSATCTLINNPICGDGAVNQAAEECDGQAGLQPGQVCGADCRIVPACGNGVVEAGEQCDSSAPTCVACQIVEQDLCGDCINAIPEIGEFNQTVCANDPACRSSLECLKDNASCWSDVSPAACFCGLTAAQIDACELPATVAAGPCANAFRAAAPGATNAELLTQYFDLSLPVGQATLIFDTAFSACRTQCFP